MSPLALGWIAAAVCLAAAVALFWRQRGLAADALQLAGTRDDLEAKLAASEKRFEDRAKAQRKRGEEIAELKKKLEKARKRTAAAHDVRSGDSSRLAQLEASLSRVEAERVKAQREVDSLRTDLERRPAVSRDRPPARPPAAAQSSQQDQPSQRTQPDQPADPTRSAAAVSADPMDHPAAKALAKRAEQAEARLQDRVGELASARNEAERHKRRAAALDTAYLAQHGELEAKKDRLKTQQEELERLRAMRVTLGATDPVTPLEPSDGPDTRPETPSAPDPEVPQ